MFKAVKEWWYEVMMPAFKWFGRHWLGFTVLTAGTYVGISAVLFCSWKAHEHKIKKLYEEEERP